MRQIQVAVHTDRKTPVRIRADARRSAVRQSRIKVAFVALEKDGGEPLMRKIRGREMPVTFPLSDAARPVFEFRLEMN